MTPDLWLVVLLLAIAIGGLRFLRWTDRHAPRWTLKKPKPLIFEDRPSEAEIHAAMHRIRSFSEPATKGAKAGAMRPTNDDRIVDEHTQRRQQVSAIASFRRTH